MDGDLELTQKLELLHPSFINLLYVKTCISNGKGRSRTESRRRGRGGGVVVVVGGGSLL